MPLDSSALLDFNLKNASATAFYYDKKYTRAYFLLMNDGKNYEAYVMMVIADPAYVKNDMTKLAHNTYRKYDADFSGVVLYFTPKGEYLNGYAYQNGQLLGVPSSSNQSIQSITDPKLKTDVSAPVTCKDWYLITYDKETGEILDTQYLYTLCSPDVSGSGSSGGSSAPPPPNCTPPPPPVVQSTGHLIINVATPPPGGFPRPAPPCLVDKSVPDTTTLDPCAQAKALALNAAFKALMNDLNSKTGLNYEDAYTFNLDANGNLTSTPFQGQPNSSTVELTFNGGPVDGYAHDHYAGDFPTFSGADIQQIYNMMALNHIKNTATFTASVVTSSGTTYIIKISDPVKFTAFGQANLTPSQFSGFESDYANNQLRYKLLGNDIPTSYELALMLELQDSGLVLFKGNSSFTAWTPTININDKEVTTNCN
jgi:hypothetical protein